MYIHIEYLLSTVLLATSSIYTRHLLWNMQDALVERISKHWIANARKKYLGYNVFELHHALNISNYKLKATQQTVENETIHGKLK